MESSYLHPYIIDEILSRVSTESFGRCRVASRQWNQQTYDSKFKENRYRNTNIIDGFIVQSLVKNQQVSSFSSVSDEARSIYLDFLPGFNVRVEAVSANHGILLCRSDNPRQSKVPLFFVCKPHVKLFRQIPNPRIKFYTEGFAMSVLRSSPFHFKILRLSSSKITCTNKRKKLISEVFDSETWIWKRSKDIILPLDVWFSGRAPVISVCGAFHWLMRNNLIFSFDVEKEEWKTIRLPVDEDEYGSVDIVEYEGKLALICMDTEYYMHTWVLENYKNLVWKKRFVVNMKDPESDGLSLSPMAFYGSDIIVARGIWSMIYYDFKIGKVLKVAQLEKHKVTDRVFAFWSDSEPFCFKTKSKKVREIER